MSAKKKPLKATATIDIHLHVRGKTQQLLALTKIFANIAIILCRPKSRLVGKEGGALTTYKDEPVAHYGVKR